MTLSQVPCDASSQLSLCTLKLSQFGFLLSLLSLFLCLLLGHCSLSFLLTLSLPLNIGVQLSLSILFRDPLLLESFPKLLNFFLVLSNQLWAFNGCQILLITIDGLSSPVKTSGQKYLGVNDHEFVMHVVPHMIIHGHLNPLDC